MSETLRKMVQELDILGTAADDSGRLAVEAMLSVLVNMRDMDSPNAREWVLDIVSRLGRHEVLSPLTGQAHEWREIPPHQRAGELNYQNTRETAVMAKAAWRPTYADERGQIGWNKDKDEVKPINPEVFQIEHAVDTQGIRIQRGVDDAAGWRTWVPITFPYMPQRYYLNVGEDDPTPDHELENIARMRALGDGQVVFGGKV